MYERPARQAQFGPKISQKRSKITKICIFFEDYVILWENKQLLPSKSFSNFTFSIWAQIEKVKLEKYF